MRTVIDWSYSLLGQDEQRFFRALGIFPGGFTIDAAAAVAMDSKTTEIGVIDRLADLVRKSLVVTDVSGVKPRFRLLETIRSYAIELLGKSDEAQSIARRHADYYRRRLCTLPYPARSYLNAGVNTQVFGTEPRLLPTT